MKLKDSLQSSEHFLESAGIGTARLDTLVLLEDVSGWDRTQILAEPDRELTATQVAKLEKLLKRRAEHAPLAYVRGKTEFYGREFVVTPAVLEPRPESETMIDLLKDLEADGALDDLVTGNKKNDLQLLRLADVGTGSGALGITAKLELGSRFNTIVDLIEIDQKALQVAKINVDKYTMDISIVRSDLLAHTTQEYDVLLCNLPYVPDDHTINQAAMLEPKRAIFGGVDGLDLYRKLFKQLHGRPNRPLYILTESLPTQHTDLEQIGLKYSYGLLNTDDFIQVFKLQD